MQVNIPCIVISAPMSGSGKSTITTGLMAALAEDHIVQGFKVGPDYIDPGYHTLACKRVSRNLDTWMVSHERVKQSFAMASQDADIAVIEGVMGLYDGYDALSEDGSTAQVAKLVDAPVILVIDVGKMARSAGAIALGFQNFDPDLRFGGVICNNVASQNHATWVTQAVESIGIPVLGCIPRHENLHIPERHLGLHTAVERQAEIEAFLQSAAALILEHIDLEQIWSVAKQTTPIQADLPTVILSSEYSSTVKIAVARDEAFSFYYEDNFDYLRAAGVELIEFSPLHDKQLPTDIAGIYLGGGYPELYAAQFSENTSMLQALRQAIKSDMPLYAECGGLMILTEKIIDLHGESHPMLGILPGYTQMRERVRLGYREITAKQDTLLHKAGETVRGHEFHYSDWINHEDCPLNAYAVKSRRDEAERPAGITNGNLLASYIHLHFGSLPTIANRFVEQCMLWKATMQ